MRDQINSADSLKAAPDWGRYLCKKIIIAIHIFAAYHVYEQMGVITMSRTNVVLDDNLVQEAMRLSGVKTKKEVVSLALQEFVINNLAVVSIL